MIKKNHILCEIVPGSVAFACFYLSISISSVFQFLLVVINLTSILVTVYLTREMRLREFEDDDLVSPRTNQLMFIGLTGFMFVICLYRGISETEYPTTNRLYRCILCLFITLLLMWGLKYYKK
ncbi:immunity protein BlpL [Streptococcus pneumoniae]|nr:immunity protein BlpL [Streptococcus pneumoniae]